MYASVISGTSGPEVITINDVPEPDVGDADILVDVRASTVNRTDVWVRRSHEGDPTIVTGSDVAGEIADVGADVDSLAPGDRVVLYWNTTYCGECEFCNNSETTLCRDYDGLGVETDGGHAEYVAVDAKHAVELPPRVVQKRPTPSRRASGRRGAHCSRAPISDRAIASSFSARAAASGTAQSRWSHTGSTVYAASSLAEEVAKLRNLGVDHVINYTEEDIDDAIDDLTDRRGVDVVFESIGGEPYKQAVRSLARGGWVVTIGATAGDADAGMLQHVF